MSANVLTSDRGLMYFSPEREAAWMGILQVHAELTRALDAALSARHAMTFSTYDVLARIAFAPEGALRMSELAAQTQLSLSRVSRVVDAHADRGLVERRSCNTDSRVVYATITDAGRTLVAEAQGTFFEVVEERYLARLSDEDVGRLGEILGKLVSAPLGSTCPGAQP
jgi:DNA-binding MarR family transcriptional regulator